MCWKLKWSLPGLTAEPSLRPLTCCVWQDPWFGFPKRSKFLYFILFLFHVFECFACMYICVLHACLVLMEVRRKHWIPRQLELLTVVVAENQTWVVWKNSQCSLSLSHLCSCWLWYTPCPVCYHSTLMSLGVVFLLLRIVIFQSVPLVHAGQIEVSMAQTLPVLGWWHSHGVF